ncbi:DNA-binding SARP family transcriptional activator [Amycolatopsis cihanbeyliensis]|uniref:DNA-binding SARP family transcriptional activator n=1 Tax=Amycolatopsis cihanbeyliensis TaxID=1128664 RepID=A0A542DR81_AMYCI|nr:BTAD domain-containing putative transcriptional regulator [Amycolatopsis cihanbeyliensis]TQJ05609.1 DNA-binding SARP family transcriptional activator [Amycolatopsis cihanbeyliensis]
MAGRALPLGGPKPRMLLATLLLQAGTPVSTDLLVEVLWPGRAPRSAAANIRTYVHSLRRRLAEGGGAATDRIESRSAGYLLTAEPEEIDLLRFENQVATARQALAEQDPRTALDLLDRADRLWRGDPLDDLTHSHVWGSTLARVGELRLSANEQRLRIKTELGWHDDVVAELRGLLTEHPLREQFWQQLVLALGAAGRHAEALQAYEQAEQTLFEELGTTPGPQLRAAGQRLLDAPRPVEQPESVCQLPLDLPDFTGRTELRADLLRLVRERAGRQLPTVAVLTGPPGVGKSALAVRIAHAVRARFPDGQLHVDLAGTARSPRSPLDVLPELLHALGVRDANMPANLAERSALLRSRLSGKRMCIVLDDAGSSAQVRPLLPGAGGCAVLVTSRLRLPDLEGAHPTEVEVLPETEANELLSGLVGARRLAAEPEATADILRFCDYLPLAIRVAGARLRHRSRWPLRTLADRLRDEHGRLDELRVGDLAVRASVTLSYDLLPEQAARAFRLLGLLGPAPFPGWVVAALLDREGAEDVLDALVDAHLVEPVGPDAAGRPRYRLHDLLRCYAAGRAAEGSGDHNGGHADAEDHAGRRDAVQRVLTGYLTLALHAAEAMPIHFFGVFSTGEDTRGWRPAAPAGLVADPATWFEAERRAGVAAVELAAEWELNELAWRLAAAFTPYFDLRGHHEDWHHTHVIALAAARRAGSPRGRAIMLRNLGQIHLYRDAYADALDAFEQSYRLFLWAGYDRGAAIALSGIGTVLRIRGENTLALERSRQALALCARAGDRHSEAAIRLAIGTVWLAKQHYPRAREWFLGAYELSAEIGDRHREAHALNRLGLLQQRQGNLAAAREHVDRAIAIFDELGDDHCVGYANQHLGELCLYSGDLAHARLLLVNSLSAHRRNGDRRSEAEISELLGRLHEALGQSDRSRPHYDRALRIWRELAADGGTRSHAERRPARTVPTSA